MKKMTRFLMMGLLGVLVLLVGGFVTAQASPYISWMDEYGPGYYKDTGASNPTWTIWDGMVRQDPTWTGKDSLTYIGARGDFTGYFDVAVLDPTGGISDVLRFYNPPLNTNPLEPNYTWIIFYSGTGSAPADRNGIPPEISTGFTFGDGHLHVLYTVNENSDGTFLWESTTGNNFYGWSEGHAPNPTVPLPAAIWLLGPGLVGLAAIRRRLMK